MRDLVLPLALGGDPLLEVLVYWNILPSLTAPYLRSLLRRCFKMVTLYGWWLQRLSGHAAVKTAHTADIFRLSTSLHALTARVVTAAMGNDSLHRLASDWRGQWDELWQGLPVEQQEVIEMMLVSLHTASGGFTRSSKNGSGLLDAMVGPMYCSASSQLMFTCVMLPRPSRYYSFSRCFERAIMMP